MALFESYERRIDQINKVLNGYGISSIEEAEKITKDAGLDVYEQVKKIQPICFENACWAYTVGAAIAIKKGGRFSRFRCRHPQGGSGSRQSGQDAAGGGDRLLLLPGRP